VFFVIVKLLLHGNEQSREDQGDGCSDHAGTIAITVSATVLDGKLVNVASLAGAILTGVVVLADVVGVLDLAVPEVELFVLDVLGDTNGSALANIVEVGVAVVENAILVAGA